MDVRTVVTGQDSAGKSIFVSDERRPPPGGYRFTLSSFPPQGNDPPADIDVETTLRAGDCVVQNGTRHRWHNRGTGPAVIAAAIIGATRS